jgi:hypothetical protein
MTFCIYLNEQSLVSQFDSVTARSALRELFGCIDMLSLCKGVKINYSYINELLYNSSFLANHDTLHHYLNRDKGLLMKFRKKTKCFNSIAEFSKPGVSYLYAGKEYIDSTVGEAYEHCNNSLLLNWMSSPFREPKIIVSCDNMPRNVKSFYSVSCLRNYLETQGWLTKVYDINSNVPPRDVETILCDPDLFVQTNQTYDGRKIYERIGEDELWYVDNKHCGPNAHLEVFSKTTRRQIHVSRIDKIDFFRSITKDEHNRTI